MYSILEVYRKNDSDFNLKSIISAQKFTVEQFSQLLVQEKLYGL